MIEAMSDPGLNAQMHNVHMSRGQTLFWDQTIIITNNYGMKEKLYKILDQR